MMARRGSSGGKGPARRPCRIASRHVVAILLLAGVARPQGTVENPSFEEGDKIPAGWLLDGQGRWPGPGHIGSRGASVTGTGQDVSFWRSKGCRFRPGRIYTISFWARREPGAAGGTLTAGPSFANRDFRASEDWRRYRYAFVTPLETREAFLRFGQWHLRGQATFDGVELRPAWPVHGKVGTSTLGSGESIEGNGYRAEHILSGPGSNYTRFLESFTASFNSDRWVLESGSDVVYKHSPGRTQVEASYEITIGYHRKGDLLVQASSDGRTWTPCDTASGPGTYRFQVPKAILPSETVIVRMALDEGSLQVTRYRYQSRLEGAGESGMGTTHFIEILDEDTRLELEFLPLGFDAIPLRLTSRSREKGRLTTELLFPGTHPWKDERDAAPGAAVEVAAPIPPLGIGEHTGEIRISLGEDRVFTGRVPLRVTAIRARDFGILLRPTDAQGRTIWGCDPERTVGRFRAPPAEATGEATKATGAIKAIRAIKAIKMEAARGEFVACQVVAHAREGLRNVTCEAEDLTRREGGIIPRRQISVRRVGYLRVRVPTDDSSEPGDWPDPVIPAGDPVDIPPGANQPFWVTVEVPDGIAPGTYRGRVTIRGDGFLGTAPIELEVWDFTLDPQTHLTATFGFSPDLVRRYHRLENDAQLREVIDKYWANFSAHRIAPYDPAPFDPIQVRFTGGDGGPRTAEIDFSRFDAALSRAMETYRFNSFRLGLRSIGGGTFHSRHEGEIRGFKAGTPEYEEWMGSYLGQVEAHLREKGWLEKAYVYWFDEPEPRDYDFVKGVMERIHRHAPGVRRMLTEEPVAPLFGAVDIWCPVLHAYDPTVGRERSGLGEEIWWYICTGPKAPYTTLFTDHPAIERRTWLWLTWKEGIRGILIWQTNYWTSPTASPDSLQNPYDDPMSYVTGYGRKPGTIGYWGNGDGRFIYPPAAVFSGEDGPVLEGPVDSIRWELFRDGIEDYEYFHRLKTLLDGAGAKEGDEKARAFEALLQVPDEVARDRTDFSLDPAPLAEHRRRIAEAIVHLEKGKGR